MRKSVFKTIHTALFMALFHLGTACTFYFCWSWRGLMLLGAAWFLYNCPGVGMTFHRLLTHRSYQVPKLVEYGLVILGCLALQGSPLRWVVTHRIHHEHAEEPGGDPHTPRDGTLWAQWFWMILPNPALQYPGGERAMFERYAPDLLKDKFYLWIHRRWYVPSIVLGAILLVVGWPSPFLVLWVALAPVAPGWEITWLVNSVTHKWGRRSFETPDDSTNNWWVALLTFGEGWHNNHHKYPTSARHGLKWYQIDLNWYGIWFLKLFGIAKHIKLPKPATG